MIQHSSPSGFTVIELLVSLAIMAIVSSQLLLVFQGQQEAYVTNERILDIQEDARLVMDLISTETRMAGFMVPRVTGLTSINGGAAPDIFCVSDANEIADGTLATASQPFDRGRPLGPTAVGATSIFLQPGDLDIDSDGADDFSTGQALIIADSTNSWCAPIVTVDAAAGRLDLPAVFAIPTAFPTTARVVPAVMYQVGGAGGLGLSRNGLLLSAEVEDLQVEFGVDVNGDSIIDPLTGEFPIHNLAGFDPASILQVRLTVTTRTAQGDQDFTGQFPAAADRPGGAATDNFRRRRFVASIRPRNLGNP